MAASDILYEAGKSIVGGLAKAKIEIEDGRINEVQVIDIVNDNQKKLFINRSSESFKVVDASNIKATKTAFEKTLNYKGTKKTYTVRFNPSQLSINAVGGGKVAKTNFDDSGNSKVEYASMDVNIQLTVRLIFDDMRVTDSFMNEVATPVNGLHKAYHAKRGTRNSVQAQVEGFIGALRNDHTRRVTFNWGKLSYAGVLNYMNAEYTMFSIHGRPVRAHVDIGILCADKETSDKDGPWKDKFNAAFIGTRKNLETVGENLETAGENLETTGENLETVGQNVGNLFNINL